VQFNKLIMQLIDGTRLPSYEDTISEAKVRISDSEWVALIAYYLTLVALHTGEPKITPELFSTSRGIDNEQFTRRLKKHRNAAEAYKRRNDHRELVNEYLKPKLADHIKSLSKTIRSPRKTADNIKAVANYLLAKKSNSDITQQDFATTSGIANSKFSQLLRTHRIEAEAYNNLRGDTADSSSKSGEDKLVQHKKMLPLFGKELWLKGNNTHKQILKSFSNAHNLDKNLLDSLWTNLKDTLQLKNAVRAALGMSPEEPKKPVRKPKPTITVEKPTLMKGRGGYAPKFKGPLDDAWLNLAAAIERRGLTKRLILDNAHLVGVSVIRKVKKFPSAWRDKHIIRWMSSHSDEYVKLAGPKIEQQLREQGLWNPPQETTAKAMARPTTTPSPAEKEPWEHLASWRHNRKPKVLIIGGIANRMLEAHQWVYRYFDINYIEVGVGTGRGNSSTSRITNLVSAPTNDLILLMSGYMGHSQSGAVTSAVHPSVPLVLKSGTKPLRSINQAATAVKDKGTAPWFVEAFEAEKGPIVDSLDQDIYNLLERIGLERLLA